MQSPRDREEYGWYLLRITNCSVYKSLMRMGLCEWGKKDESEAVRGPSRHVEAYTSCAVSNGELWKLCEQIHADH